MFSFSRNAGVHFLPDPVEYVFYCTFIYVILKNVSQYIIHTKNILKLPDKEITHRREAFYIFLLKCTAVYVTF